MTIKIEGLQPSKPFDLSYQCRKFPSTWKVETGSQVKEKVPESQYLPKRCLDERLGPNGHTHSCLPQRGHGR